MLSSLLVFAALASGYQSPLPTGPDEILSQLSKINLDKTQLHSIRDVTLRRDVLTLSFNRGAIAFLEPVNGKVTGAVFVGNGEVVAILPDAVEKQQMHKFTGTPILNQPFQTAILRFTDQTYEEIRKEISEHAEEDVSAEDAAQLQSWGNAIAGKSIGVNLRLLVDFLEDSSEPLFLAELNGDKTGWFDVLFDRRSPEEVSVFQLHDAGSATVPDIWASFNQRSEARDLEAVAHENKSPVEILSYDVTGTETPGNNIDAKASVRIAARRAGTRVLTFELSRGLHVTAVETDSGPVPFYQLAGSGSLSVVLAQPVKEKDEFTLTFSYSGEAGERDAWYPGQQQQTIPAFRTNLNRRRYPVYFEYEGRTVAPASYHDEWLLQSLERYVFLLTKTPDSMTPALTDAREALKTVETAGPIWVGRRLASTVTPDGYRAAEAKGIWVMHMIRSMLGNSFLNTVQEFVTAFDRKTASTWDFKHTIEKQAGKKLDWFFDEWVFGNGIPTYSLQYRVDPAPNGFSVQGSVTQTGVPDGFTMPVPVYADDVYLGLVQVGDSDGEFRFRVEKKPERVVIDPESTILTAGVQ